MAASSSTPGSRQSGPSPPSWPDDGRRAGRDADQQSALNAIPVLADHPRDDFNLFYADSDQRFHMRGGNDQIPVLLGCRLGARIRAAMPLAPIARLPDGRIRLSLKNGIAMVDAVYDRVILALPFSALHAVVDCTRVGFRPLKQKAIATLPMRQSVKFRRQFDRSAWTEAGCNGEIRVPTGPLQTT